MQYKNKYKEFDFQQREQIKKKVYTHSMNSGWCGRKIGLCVLWTKSLPMVEQRY